MQSFKLAAVSMKSRPAEPEENLERHISWIEKAVDAGCDLILFPEMSVTGFCMDYKLFYPAAEKIDGASTDKMHKLAKKYDITIGYGLAERSNSDLVFNSYCFVSPEHFLGRYKKIHIPLCEYPIETGASDFNVIDLGFVKAGVNTCFDNWFSESARMSYLNGAEIIFAPFWMQWGDDSIATNPEKAFSDWKDLALKNFPSAAWQNGLYHVTINSCGGIHEKGVEYDGPSLILVINPQGDLEAQSDPACTDEQMVIHDIKEEKVTERRSEELFHPKYRRPEMYNLINEIY
ncbi:MAG: carbon-nitrogen hydrolase family protein [Planctomycetota bacterium]|jgi:predicted amidohydrolase